MINPRVQALTQAEIDDAYHLATFHCDHAVGKLLMQFFADKPDMRELRDELINLLLTGIHDVEVEHLGPRYGALMARLIKRGTPETATQ